MSNTVFQEGGKFSRRGFAPNAPWLRPPGYGPVFQCSLLFSNEIVYQQTPALWSVVYKHSTLLCSHLNVLCIVFTFHFSWVYTFSATPRSLRIWTPVPPRETGCGPALPAQLCWSSGSSFPHKAIRFDVNLACCPPLSTSQGATTREPSVFFGALAFLQLLWFLSRGWNS